MDDDTVDRGNAITSGIYVSINPAMKADVTELARREGRTVSGLVRLLLTQRLARRRGAR